MTIKACDKGAAIKTTWIPAMNILENVNGLLNDKVIAEDEKSAMDPGETCVGKFYKVLKNILFQMYL